MLQVENICLERIQINNLIYFNTNNMGTREKFFIKVRKLYLSYKIVILYYIMCVCVCVYKLLNIKLLSYVIKLFSKQVNRIYSN